MEVLNISKQKIFNRQNKTFAYELKFKDHAEQETGFSTNVKETSQLIMSSVTNKELDKLLGPRKLAFVNVDEHTILKGILDVLDKDRFVINLLEDIDLTEKAISKLIQYKKRGFVLSIENFDSSLEMIKKFSRLFNYIDILKMDTSASDSDNLAKIVEKFRGSRIKLLAQNIETKLDLEMFMNMGFDYFQGYFLDKPETIEIIGSKEPAQIIILQLIKIIKANDSTEQLEFFIKKQPDLSFKLVQFFNNSKKLNVRVESLTQVITLMGRDKLQRWLMVYLYSEASTNPASKTILELAIKRAERMEADASTINKDKAYLAGMFSMIGSIFETDVKELMEHIKLDHDITLLVVENKGIFAPSLHRAEMAEKDYLKKVMMANFEKLDTTDLIYALEDSGVEIDRSKL